MIFTVRAANYCMLYAMYTPHRRKPLLRINNIELTGFIIDAILLSEVNIWQYNSSLKEFFSLQFSLHIQLLWCSVASNPGIAGLNPVGGVTLNLVNFPFFLNSIK